MLKSHWRKRKKKEKEKRKKKEKGIKTYNMFIGRRNNLAKYHLNITWQVSTLKKLSAHILEMEGVGTIC